jgi:nitroreductase
MREALPDVETMRSSVTLATRAPSIHNSQPWRWRLGETSIHLYADQSRHLPVTDPDQRDLLLSCGATLHHLRVALAAEGWGTIVHRLPNPSEPDHLAALETVPRQATDDDIALATAITRRRTDRRRFSSWPIPATVLGLLVIKAQQQGAILSSANDPEIRAELVSAIAEAARQQEADADYTSELASWSGARLGSREGVPAANVPPAQIWHRDTTMRDFPHGELRQPADETEEDGAELLVLATSSNDTMSRLRAGEAMSAIMLGATDCRLATCPLSQPLEIRETLTLVRDTVLDGSAFPQLVLRVGWPPVGYPELPQTPRRAVDDVLDHFPSD